MKGSVWGVVVLAFCGVGITLAFWFYKQDEGRARKSALWHRQVATRALAEHVAKQYPGARALVVSNPFTQKKGQPREIYEFEEAGVAGLREGFGKTISFQVVFPELRPEFFSDPRSVHVDPKTTTPLSYLVAENAFVALAEQHPDCAVIVSLIGLPVSLTRQPGWRNPAGPKYALLLPDWRIVGDKRAVQSAVKSEKIVAAVLNKPGAPPESEAAVTDPKAEFARRFLLVTKDNIDRLLQTYPQVF